MIIMVDTREAYPHPWTKYLAEGWRIGCGSLETGDLALAALKLSARLGTTQSTLTNFPNRKTTNHKKL